MTAKIIAFVLTLLANVVIGIVMLLFLIIAMNGYSESDASYGLGAYMVLALVVSVAMSTAATLTVHFLMKRQYRAWTAVAIAIPIFIVIGGGLKFVCSIIAVAIAEYVRVNH